MQHKSDILTEARQDREGEEIGGDFYLVWDLGRKGRLSQGIFSFLKRLEDADFAPALRVGMM